MASHPDHTPRRRRGALLGLALAIALPLTGCGSSDTGGKADSTTLGGAVPSPAPRVGTVTLPEVAVGKPDKPFRFIASDGGLLFVTFGYTNCPDVCPTTLSDLKKAIGNLGDAGAKVDAAFVTVDPERDLPENLEPYLSSFVTDGHAIRTTDQAALQKAKDAFGVTSSVTKATDGTVSVAHTSRSFVVDDKGRIVVEWPFGTGSDGMTHDLKILTDQL